MAEKIKDGGPAFPFEYEVPNIPEFDPERPNAMYPMTKSKVVCPGMTLRDYFAAKAMQGFIHRYDEFDDLDQIVSESYLMADKMLATRENGNG